MDYIEKVKTRFLNCASELASEDYGQGYLDALEHLRNEIDPPVPHSIYLRIKITTELNPKEANDSAEQLADTICSVLTDICEDEVDFVEVLKVYKVE